MRARCIADCDDGELIVYGSVACKGASKSAALAVLPELRVFVTPLQNVFVQRSCTFASSGTLVIERAE